MTPDGMEGEADSLGLPVEARDDLLARGYSRRHLAKVVGLLGTGSAVMAAMRPGPARAAPAPAAVVHIDANECWTGPFTPAVQAGATALSTGNRYTGPQRDAFIKTVAAVENVPSSHVMPWPGSSDPLARSVITFCSPGRGLVTADPTFELAGSVAEWMGIKVSRVPLRPDFAHDVKAMLAADPNAGIYYICTPNNPSATLTSLPDVEWLIANKPAGSIVLLDEAYIHFAGAPTGSYLAAQDKDVIVLRTFSKIFGMAGLRMGLTMARPDLTQKMMRYDGMMASYALPNPSLVAATTALTQAALITQRREEMIRARKSSLDLLDQRKITYVPPSANFFMVDWKKPAKDVQAAFLKEGVSIGRSWPIWPTYSRVTVGSADEMHAFNKALIKLNL